MVDQQAIFERMIAVLDEQGIKYRLYHHRPVHSYEDAELAKAEAGFDGVEGKVVVCKVGDGFAVYVTLQGERMDMKRAKQLLGSKKLRLAQPDELWRHFAAEPGAAYPFGFADDIPILIDPAIYAVDWFLCSAAVPTATIQIRGRDLRRLYEGLPNPVSEIAWESA